MIGWSGQPFSVIMEAAAQYFENSLQKSRRKRELKTMILALQLESLEKQKYDFENNLKLIKSPPYVPLDNCRYCKKS